MKYKVLKEFVSKNGLKIFKEDDEYEANHLGKFTAILLENGFIEPKRPEVDFGLWEREGKRSELAKVIIAPEDYEEGEKKYFTWQEAMNKVKELNNGWRLPTNKEWNLLAWEFGEKDDVISSEVFRKNLNLDLKGFVDKEGEVRSSGIYGYGWSSRANSSDLRYAYYLSFNASGVYPSNGSYRWGGFPLRLVKDMN